MKPKTARRILARRSWEMAERKIIGLGYKKWLGRLEDKCRQVVMTDKMDRVFCPSKYVLRRFTP